MSFEILRLMAQDYADRHKDPLPLPATIDTIVYAYQRMCQGEDPWAALGDFSNAWYGYAKHLRTDLIKEPLSRPEQETEQSRQWGAFCAASVEYLCDLFHLPCPQWVHDPCYILDVPWWNILRPDDPDARAYIRTITPPSFARRNIFCSHRLYQNKYEMYEWMQEAIAKGMTDVHEIHRYARQKEISRYGA